MIKAATHAEYMNCGSFYSLVCAEWGYPFHGLSQSDAESVFFAPKPYADTASGQKTLKRAKVNMAKAANYDKSRSPR